MRRCLSIVGSKIGDNHAGDYGARLCEIESGNGWVHSVELLPPAQQLGVDCADLVEHLAQLVKVGKVLAHHCVAGIRHIIHLWPLACSADRQIVLGAMAPIVGAVAAWPAAALVSLDQ